MLRVQEGAFAGSMSRSAARCPREVVERPAPQPPPAARGYIMMRCSPLRGMASARWRRSIARLLMVLPCSASPAVRDYLRYTRRRPPWLLASAREEMQSLVLCETARSALAALVLLLASALTAHRGRARSLVPVQVDVVLSVALLSLYRERPADRGPLPSPTGAHSSQTLRVPLHCGGISFYTDAYIV